jgi:hypothetical protein
MVKDLAVAVVSHIKLAQHFGSNGMNVLLRP